MYSKNDVVECIFQERINRFVAKVLINDEEVLVHVKNTGRCAELFIKGRKAYLLKSHNKKRKYQYDLISIYKDDLLINIDSQIPNKVVYKYIEDGNIFKNIVSLKREVTYNNSRFDIYLEYIDDNEKLQKAFIEVKGVTLFYDDLATFPDAVTERGRKHLNELVDAKKEGYGAYAFFLIQGDNIKRFRGNYERDEKFCDALKNAYNNGVEVLAYNCNITKDDITVNEKVTVEI